MLLLIINDIHLLIMLILFLRSPGTTHVVLAGDLVGSGTILVTLAIEIECKHRKKLLSFQYVFKAVNWDIWVGIRKTLQLRDKEKLITAPRVRLQFFMNLLVLFFFLPQPT